MGLMKTAGSLGSKIFRGMVGMTTIYSIASSMVPIEEILKKEVPNMHDKAIANLLDYRQIKREEEVRRWSRRPRVEKVNSKILRSGMGHSGKTNRHVRDISRVAVAKKIDADMRGRRRAAEKQLKSRK